MFFIILIQRFELFYFVLQEKQYLKKITDENTEIKSSLTSNGDNEVNTEGDLNQLLSNGTNGTDIDEQNQKDKTSNKLVEKTNILDILELNDANKYAQLQPSSATTSKTFQNNRSSITFSIDEQSRSTLKYKDLKMTEI